MVESVVVVVSSVDQSVVVSVIVSVVVEVEVEVVVAVAHSVLLAAAGRAIEHWGMSCSQRGWGGDELVKEVVAGNQTLSNPAPTQRPCLGAGLSAGGRYVVLELEGEGSQNLSRPVPNHRPRRRVGDEVGMGLPGASEDHSLRSAAVSTSSWKD